MQLGKNSLIILGILLILSCSRSSKKNPVTVSENKYCYITSPDIPGKQYLSETFLTTIANIKTNPTKKESLEGMVHLKGGNFAMGADIPIQHDSMQATALPQNDEFPKHEVMVNGFYMDTHEVTVGEFEEFVKATNYITVAEIDINWEELKKQLPKGVLPITGERSPVTSTMPPHWRSIFRRLTIGKVSTSARTVSSTW